MSPFVLVTASTIIIIYTALSSSERNFTIRRERIDPHCSQIKKPQPFPYVCTLQRIVEYSTPLFSQKIYVLEMI